MWWWLGMAIAGTVPADAFESRMQMWDSRLETVVVTVRQRQDMPAVRALRTERDPQLRVRGLGSRTPEEEWTHVQYRYRAACMAVVDALPDGSWNVDEFGRCDAPLNEEDAPVRPDGTPLPAPDAAPLTVVGLVIEDDLGAITAVSDTRTRQHMLTLLRDHGYDVRGGENEMFGDDRTGQAALAIGGRVTGWERVRDAWWEVAIEWDLYDVRSDQVLYRVTTLGLGEGSAENGRIREAVDEAFLRLLARPAFVQAVSADLPEAGLTPPDWQADLDVKRCDARPLVLPRQLEEATEAVVTVYTPDGTGSGVNISPDGFVLTAAHVVSEHETVEVRLLGGQSVDARPIRVDAAQDVAVVSLPGTGYACVGMAEEPARLGADIFVVGSPMGRALDFSVSRGIVSGFRRFGGVRFVQTDASINAGNSGGPMFDEHGAVQAVVSWKIAAEGFEGLGFGVPVEALIERLGMRLADQSSAEPASLEGVVAAAEPVVDDPNERWIPPYVLSTEEQQRLEDARSRELSVRSRRGKLILSGAAVTLVGVGLIAGTAAHAGNRAGYSDAGWTSVVALNTTGWVLAHVGPFVVAGGAL